MKEYNKKVTRRELLVTATIGSVATTLVLPAKWKAPVVELVVTPAHAAASAPSTTSVPYT